MKLMTAESELLAKEIFDADPQIVHLGLIDLEGNVLLDQSSAASEPTEPDEDRIAFYHQLDVRRHAREHLDEAYGQTDYVHIIREKMQQVILYLPKITVYLTLEKSMTPDEVKAATQKIKFLDSDIMKSGV
ncbi:hypothetical protein Nmar_1465 [Nitrosopumilus maritimus SCM1]|uniref:Roadblock/LC7 family protein n=2 Tax=Nitrosopumilus maritimus TaxID=338192 RepID=A9A3U9_NITMS|nr:hypothetical protein Nmar_1465 [Nitrosopumilus maritimus SCM1]